jgi:hypothetical protein
MKTLCSLFLAALLGLSSHLSQAQVVDLSFDTLPSAQGWTHQGNVVESEVSSVSAGVLTHSTLANPLDNNSFYTRANPFDPSTPFNVDVTARVNSSQPSGIYTFTVLTGSESFQVQLQNGSVSAQGESFALDTSVFHDFRLEARPSQGSELFVDDVSIGTFDPVSSSVSSQLLFGDTNPFPNSDVSVGINQLTLTAVPEPERYGVVAGLALLGLAVCRRSSRQRFPRPG